MVKAALTLDNGRRLFVFGLSARNLELLREGRPIAFDLEPMGGMGRVAILFGETEADIADQLRRIGPLPGDASA